MLCSMQHLYFSFFIDVVHQQNYYITVQNDYLVLKKLVGHTVNLAK